MKNHHATECDKAKSSKLSHLYKKQELCVSNSKPAVLSCHIDTRRSNVLVTLTKLAAEEFSQWCR